MIAVYDWLPHKNIGLFIGLSQFIGVLGPMMAAGPLDSLSEAGGISWRYVFIVLSIVGVVLAVITIFVVKNNSQTTEKFIIVENSSSGIISGIRSLFSNKQVWLVYSYIFSHYLFSNRIFIRKCY